MIFKNLFAQRDPLESQAASLVSACNIQATTMHIPMLDGYSFLKDCKLADWDFFVTVAGVHVALDILFERVTPERFSRLVKIVEGKLIEKHPQAPAALGDCEAFVGRTFDKLKPANRSEVAQWAVGMWVLSNVLRRTPTREETHAAAGLIVSMLAHALKDWWTPSS